MFLDEFDHIIKISIHALREEGDRKVLDDALEDVAFLSTPSARRATGCRWALSRASRFLSTPSARRATTSVPLCLSETCISIHALREEGDPPKNIGSVRPFDFYPRPPRGGRQQKQRQNLYFLINYTTFCTNLEEP